MPEVTAVSRTPPFSASSIPGQDTPSTFYHGHTLQLVAAEGGYLQASTMQSPEADPTPVVKMRATPGRRALQNPLQVMLEESLLPGSLNASPAKRDEMEIVLRQTAVKPADRQGMYLDDSVGDTGLNQTTHTLLRAVPSQAHGIRPAKFAWLWQACQSDVGLAEACRELFAAFPDKVMATKTGEGVFRASLDANSAFCRVLSGGPDPSPQQHSSGKSLLNRLRGKASRTPVPDQPAPQTAMSLLKGATLQEQSHLMKDLLQQVIGKLLGKLDDTADVGLCMQWTHELDDYLRSEGGAHEQSAVDGFSRLLTQLKQDGRGKAELTVQSMWTSSALIPLALQCQRASLSPALEQALTLRGVLMLNVRPVGSAQERG